MKKPVISIVFVILAIGLMAAYIPGNVGQTVIFNNEVAIDIGTKDQWYELDGFTDENFNILDSNFVQDPAGKGVIPLISGIYRASYYFNYTKDLGANDVQFEICATENGACYSGTKVKITAISANQFQAAGLTFVLPLTKGNVYGQAVRNVTNTDDPVFFSFSQVYQKIR